MSKTNEHLDRRIIRTRKLLRESLIALIAEKGFDAITINDLTDRATLNRATFYLHYRDKQDLLDQSVDEVLNTLKDKLKAHSYPLLPRVKGQPLPGLVSLFEHVTEHTDFYKVMLGEHGMPGFTTRLIQTLKELCYQSFERIPPERLQGPISKDILISYITAAYLGVIIWWLQNDMPYSAKYMAQQVTYLTNFSQTLAEESQSGNQQQ